MTRNPLNLLRLWSTGRASRAFAEQLGATGMEFDRFGRRMGRELALRGRPFGLRYVIAPVSSTRYWEFPFILSCLPEAAGTFLDVSSPHLFSFYAAGRSRSSRVVMINPDDSDLRRTREIIDALGITNIEASRRGLGDPMTDLTEGFDCVWSISVIEHIAGCYDDRSAVKDMFRFLRPGGRLMLTVPVDRTCWDEYRPCDYYGTQPRGGDGLFFFQRFYDASTLRDRIISSIGREPSVVRFWGEKIRGHFLDYIDRWREIGFRVTVDDPRVFAENYREYESWEEMPGVGVCGMMFEKN